MNSERNEVASRETSTTSPNPRDLALNAFFASEEPATLPAEAAPAQPSKEEADNASAAAAQADNGPRGPSGDQPDVQPNEPSADQPVALSAGESAGAASAQDSAEVTSLAAEEYSRLRADLHAVAAAQRATGEQLAQLQSGLAALREQVAHLPPQLRRIAGKVDGVSTAVADANYRTLLLRLLGILDLVDGMRSSHRPEDAERHFEVLGTQLRQLLDANSLNEIPTDQPFDPTVHHAAERVETTDPGRHDRILRVLRPGFRTEQQVVRYAEVAVGYCPAAEAARTGETPPVAEPEEEDARSSQSEPLDNA